jgi:hypothetical protein
MGFFRFPYSHREIHPDLTPDQAARTTSGTGPSRTT